jgi:hypothetical protein
MNPLMDKKRARGDQADLRRVLRAGSCGQMAAGVGIRTTVLVLSFRGQDARIRARSGEIAGGGS